MPLDGLRVLVLEDEFLIALDVEQICREHGAASVEIVRNLDEVEQATFTSEGFHAAILDVMLNGRSTTDFARILMDQAIPFVFATGYIDADNLFEDFGGVPVVGKPYSGRDIIDALAEVISTAESRSGAV